MESQKPYDIEQNIERLKWHISEREIEVARLLKEREDTGTCDNRWLTAMRAELRYYKAELELQEARLARSSMSKEQLDIERERQKREF